MHVLMQRLQHQSVAAERHHDVGAGRIVIAVQLCQLRQRLLGLRACARDEGDPVISLGRGHGIAGSCWALKGAGARKVVYTTLAVLVEIASSRGMSPGSRDQAPPNTAKLARFADASELSQL